MILSDVEFDDLAIDIANAAIAAADSGICAQ